MAPDGYYIGLMSGTSMDSIDAALVEIGAGRTRLRQAISHPWPQVLEARLRRLASSETCALREYGELDHLCGRQFARAALKLVDASGLNACRIRAIGSHGQTIHHHPHAPAPFTLQIGDPNIIAEETGITVVADFRRRDMAAGGQGAPLVPAFHQAVFEHPARNRVILNIGGIANITILPASGQPVTGFDTGPGNCLMDLWCIQKRDLPYDNNGDWAAQGTPDDGLVRTLLNDDYFQLPPPKSTGTEYFGRKWLDKKLEAHPGLSDEDIQASLLVFTAATIGQAIERWAPAAEEVLVCGGGVHNQALLNKLSGLISPIPVRSTGDIAGGLDPDWVEAAAFAWLARQALEGIPGNLPSVTGAGYPVILGGIYPAWNSGDC